jgi:tRNA pseudouridine55 synthase
MNGILLIDKPQGWTSFDVVNKVRRLVQHSELNTSNKKRFPVGHTGTLDPMATGLLVLLLGKYTTHAPALTKLDKTYQVVMRLGQTSTTGDEEGQKTAVSDVQPTEAAIRQVLESFIGDSMQTPPAFSAIKINGQRAYKLARQGKTPELPPRPIHIESLQLTGYTYPHVSFTVHVSSGTYIRSLVEDAGKMLQTGAYMSDLRRTSVGIFTINEALPMDGLTPEIVAQALQLLPERYVVSAD